MGLLWNILYEIIFMAHVKNLVKLIFNFILYLIIQLEFY